MNKKGTRAQTSYYRLNLVKSKRSVSPVVATVLLIVIVVILALIIFLWARGFIKESIVKKGTNVDFACQQIKLEATYITSSGDLQIINTGNIPIYRFSVKVQSGGSISTIDSNQTITGGQSTVINIGSADSVKIVPVVLGQVAKDNSKVAYVCKTEITPDRE